MTDLDSETDRIWGERHRIVEDARELASQLLALADSAAERFPAATEETRRAPSREAEPRDARPLGGGARGASSAGTKARSTSRSEDVEDEAGKTRAMRPVVPDDAEQASGPAKPPADGTEETRRLE